MEAHLVKSASPAPSRLCGPTKDGRLTVVGRQHRRRFRVFDPEAAWKVIIAPMSSVPEAWATKCSYWMRSTLLEEFKK
jgi:hypothetical protein